MSWIAIQGNEVWFASKEEGVSRFDKVSGEWTIYKQADFLADNDVRAIARGADGNLWLATVAGISVYSPQTRSWEIISKEDGLPTPYTTSILISDQQSAVSSQQDSSQPNSGQLSVTSDQLKDGAVESDTPLTENQRSKTDNYSTDNRQPTTDNSSAQVWVGTDRGLGMRTYTGDEWIFHTPQNSNQQSAVSSQQEGVGASETSSPKAENRKPKVIHGETFVTALDTDVTQPGGVVWLGTSSGTRHV